MRTLHGVQDPQTLSKQLSASVGRTLEPGHAADRILNGDVFDTIEDLVARAERSIHIDLYKWKPGRASERILRALQEKRAAGVAVRIVVDHLGSVGGFIDEVKPKLEALGCEVRIFHPLPGTQPSKMLARDHRKLVVVDGRWGLTGGFAIWDAFLGNGHTKESWRDTALRLEGPGVRWMQQAFLENWLQAGGALPPLSDLPWPTPVGAGVTGAVVASSPRDRGGTKARALVRTLLAQSKKRLWMTVAYFTPDEGVMELLCDCSKQGVDVKLLLPGDIHDVPLVRDMGRGWYRTMLRSGVRVFEYQPAMMHAKTLVIDDHVSSVGSINMGSGSFGMLEDLAVVVWDRVLNRQLAEDFDEDLRHAREMDVRTIPLPAANPARWALRRAFTAVGQWVRGRREGEQTEAAGGSL